MDRNHIYIWKHDEENEENSIPVTMDHNGGIVLGYINKDNIINGKVSNINNMIDLFNINYKIDTKEENRQDKIKIEDEYNKKIIKEYHAMDLFNINYKIDTKEENRQDKRKIKKEDEYNKKIINKSYYSFNNNIYMNSIIKKIQYKKRRKL